MNIKILLWRIAHVFQWSVAWLIEWLIDWFVKDWFRLWLSSDSTSWWSSSEVWLLISVLLLLLLSILPVLLLIGPVDEFFPSDWSCLVADTLFAVPASSVASDCSSWWIIILVLAPLVDTFIEFVNQTLMDFTR